MKEKDMENTHFQKLFACGDEVIVWRIGVAVSHTIRNLCFGVCPGREQNMEEHAITKKLLMLTSIMPFMVFS